MKELSLAICAAEGVTPDSDAARAAVDDAAARVAKAWTEPEYVASSDGSDLGYELSDGAQVHHYRCMAEPK